DEDGGERVGHLARKFRVCVLEVDVHEAGALDRIDRQVAGQRVLVRLKLFELLRRQFQLIAGRGLVRDGQPAIRRLRLLVRLRLVAGERAAQGGEDTGAGLAAEERRVVL